MGQKCDCIKNIKVLQQTIEENQASFQHQVIEMSRHNEYLMFKNEIINKAGKISNQRDCIGLVALYLSFIKDEHCFIAYDSGYTPKSTKIIPPKQKGKHLQHPITGIWYFQDGSFSISVFPSTSTFGEWVAVIHEDQTGSWRKGQLKIEFYSDTNNALSCIYWQKNLVPRQHKVKYTDSTLLIGRRLQFYREKQNVYSDQIIKSDFYFESLSAQTNYLRIQSFDLTHKRTIDSLLTTHRTDLASKNNLIIDVRNNGGGGFETFQGLLPYVLDQNVFAYPYYSSVWVSKANLEYYDSTKYEYAESKLDSTNETMYIDFLKQHEGGFSPTEPLYDTIQLEVGLPLRIALVFNRYTASTAEGFVLQARSSGKVHTFGENSAGAVSYGDWRPIALPELNIWVAMTTKKMVFTTNEDLEGIGIKPGQDLSTINENDWVTKIMELLEK